MTNRPETNKIDLRFKDVNCERCGIMFKIVEYEKSQLVIVVGQTWKLGCSRATIIGKPWACNDLRMSIKKPEGSEAPQGYGKKEE